MTNPADDEELKRTIVSARQFCFGLAGASFACLLDIWAVRPHGAIILLSLWFFCFSVPVLANWLLLSQRDPAVEITRAALHLTAWAIIIAGVGLFLFVLSLSIVGSVIFAAAAIVSLFHLNDRNARYAAMARALAGPVMELFGHRSS